MSRSPGGVVSTEEGGVLVGQMDADPKLFDEEDLVDIGTVRVIILMLR
jgi:hypothetical protein